MFGFGKRRPQSALDELKERLTLPDIKKAESAVLEFYQGRNPYENIRAEWPESYDRFVRGFAYALERCHKEGILDWEKRENIASMAGVGMVRAGFKDGQGIAA